MTPKSRIGEAKSRRTFALPGPHRRSKVTPGQLKSKVRRANELLDDAIDVAKSRQRAL